MTPSSQKKDSISPTKPAWRPFSIATNNRRPLPSQPFRQGSIGSKSWKPTDPTNSWPGNSGDSQEKKAPSQRPQSKTPLPADFSQGFSFRSPSSLVRSTPASSNDRPDFIESKAITTASVSYERTTRPFGIQAKELVQTPPTPSPFTSSPSNSPLSSAAHSLQAPSPSSPLPIIILRDSTCPLLPAVSSISDPQTQTLRNARHETSSTSQNGSLCAVAPYEDLHHEILMEIQDGPISDEFLDQESENTQRNHGENQIEGRVHGSEEGHFEDVQPAKDGGHTGTLKHQDIEKDEIKDNIYNLQEEQYLNIVKTLEATNGRVEEFGTSVQAAQNERHPASAKIIMAMKEQLFELKTGVQGRQERQHLESLNLLEAMGTRFDEFRGSTLTAQDERYQGIEKTLETAAVHMREIKADVQILQKARHMEYEKMQEVINTQLSDLRTDVQTLQKERYQEAEKTLETTDRQLSEFKVHVQSLQDSVRQLSEERARLLLENAENEVQAKEVNSLTAKLSGMLDEKLALSEELKKRAESELAMKSQCDDQWVQIGQLQLQTQELNKQLVTARSECQQLKEMNNAIRDQLEAAEKTNKRLQNCLLESQSEHAAQIKSTIHEFEQTRIREAVEIQNQNKKNLHWISELEADLEEKNNILKMQEEQRNGLLKEQEDQINRMLREQENDRHEIQVSKRRLRQLEQDLEKAPQEKDATGSLTNAKQLVCLFSIVDGCAFVHCLFHFSKSIPNSYYKSVESPLSRQEAPMLIKDIAHAQSRDRSLDTLTEFLQWPMDLSTSLSLCSQISQSQRTRSQATESEHLDVAPSTSNMSEKHKTNAEVNQEAAMENVCEISL
ncbi:hypothetical protein EDD21DRAFT_404050, partial [Dissophora ornata]